MSAMHLVQGKVRMFDPNENVLGARAKNKALLEGRAGPEFEEAGMPPQGGTPTSEEGEICRLTSAPI
jgi:hypothetical protein